MNKSQKKKILYSIVLMLFIDGMSGGLLFPILPELFMNDKVGLILDDLFISREMLYGLCLSLIPMFSIFGMPILGALSDIYGRKKIILCGMAAMTFYNLVIVISIINQNVYFFIIGIALMGFFVGTYSVGNALIMDISDNDLDRASNFKLPVLASILGFVFSPSLSIFVNKINNNTSLITPFVIVVILGIINLFLLYNNFRKISFKQKENIINNNSNIFLILKTSGASLLYSPYSNSRYMNILILGYFLSGIALGLFFGSLSLHLARSYYYNPSQLSKFFIIMAIVMMISMYLIQPVINKYIGYKTQIKAGLIFLSVFLVLKLVFENAILNKFKLDFVYKIGMMTAMFYIVLPFITLGFNNFFANSAKKENQGKIMGSAGQIYSVATVISSLVVGKLIAISYDLILLISSVSFFFSYLFLAKLEKLQIVPTSNMNQ